MFIEEIDSAKLFKFYSGNDLEIDEKFWDDDVRRKTREVFEKMFSVEECEKTIDKIMKMINE